MNVFRVIKNQWCPASLCAQELPEQDIESAQPLLEVNLQETLFNAIRTRDIDRVESIIADCADLRELIKRESGESPLHVAAQISDSSILTYLLKKEFDVNLLEKKHKYTPLHVAIQCNNTESALLLLNNTNIDIELVDKEVRLPFHVAVEVGNITIAHKLLELKSSFVLRKNKNGQTAVHIAAEKGHLNVLQLLTHNPCFEDHFWENRTRGRNYYIDSNGNTPLILACKRRFRQCCDILLSHCDCNIDWQNKIGNSALHYATAAGYADITDILLRFNADADIINNKGNTALYESLSDNNDTYECLDMVLKKIKKLPEPNHKKDSVLHRAAMKRSLIYLEYLLQCKTFDFNTFVNEVDNNGNTPLHLAIYVSAPDNVNLLVNLTDPNIVNNKGNYPLHLAARNDFNICRMVMKTSKELINVKNHNGDTPLHLAAKNCNPQCCTYLISNGASLQIKNKAGETPLSSAVVSDMDEIVECLIKNGAAIKDKSTNNEGNTPLHLAAINNSLRCCKIIMSYSKWSSFIKNDDRRMPINEAFEHKHDEIFCYIIANMDKDQNKKRHDELEDQFKDYLEKAQQENRWSVVEAILDSSWWKLGFCCDSKTEWDRRTKQFISILIKNNSSLTVKVFDTCIEHTDTETIYDFRILNNLYSNDDFSHPLEEILHNFNVPLLMHPLTTQYLNKMWASFTYFWALVYLMFKFIYAIVVTLYMFSVTNWHYMSIMHNITEIEYLVQYTNCTVTNSTESNTTEDSSESGTNKIDLATHGLSVTLLTIMMWIMAAGFVTYELTSFFLKIEHFRFRRHTNESLVAKDKPLVFIYLLRILTLVVASWPMNYCFESLGIVHFWQWIAGLLLMVGIFINLIYCLNESPRLSIFLPVTPQFVIAFVKVVAYFIAIIFCYSVIFRLLLPNHDAFTSSQVSFFKTLAWILGDLAYDDTFLSDKNPILYPWTTNIFFMLSTVVIGGFIANLIIVTPSDHLDVFRKEAALLKSIKEALYFTKLYGRFGRFWNFDKFNKKIRIKKKIYCSKSMQTTLENEDNENITERLANVEQKLSELVTLLNSKAT